MIRYWEKLLVNWRRTGRDGLTVPFLVGSQSYLPAASIHQDIEELIEDIAKHDALEVYLRYCLDTDELILGVRDAMKSKIPGKFPLLDGKPQRGLFVTNFHPEFQDDISSIVAALEERYQSVIDQELYSRINGQWSRYSELEITFIQNSFSDQ